MDIVNVYEYIDGIFIVLFIGIYVFYWNLLIWDVFGMDIVLEFFYGILGFGYFSYVVNGGNLVIVRFVVGIYVWVKKVDNYGNFFYKRFFIFFGYFLIEIV